MLRGAGVPTVVVHNTKMFLDTNFLIDLETELLTRNVWSGSPIPCGNRNRKHEVSVISAGEVATGLNDDAAARQFLSKFPIVSLKLEIALEAVAIDREQSALGLRLGENDNWIAGFARYHRSPLASNDMAFDRVRGLRCIAY